MGEIEKSVRTEFGFPRTTSNHPLDILNCKFIPGYLIPDDLNRIASHLGYDTTLKWGMESLLASPGAKISVQGQVINVPTLVPKRQSNGHCIYLNNDLCKIHPVAPFGCAFFDSFMSTEECNKRSLQGLIAILKEWESPGLYAEIWVNLRSDGKVSSGPTELRKRLDEEYNKLMKELNK